MDEYTNEKYLKVNSNNKEILLYGLDDLFYFIRNSKSFNDTDIFSLIQSGKVTSWITLFNKIIADELIKFESTPKKYLFFAYLYCRRYCYKNSNFSFNDIIGYEDVKKALSKVNQEIRTVSFSSSAGKDNLIFSNAFLENSQYILIDSDFYYLSYFFNDINDKKNIFQKLELSQEELELDDFKTKLSLIFLFTPMNGGLIYKGKSVKRINYLNPTYDGLLQKIMDKEINWKLLYDIIKNIHVYDDLIDHNETLGKISIYIRTPNYEERVAYFKKYLSKFHTDLFCGYLPVIPLSENINYEELAKKTEFYSIKDIELICYNSLLEILNITNGDKDAKVTQEIILSKFFKTANFSWFEEQMLVLKRRKGSIDKVYLEEIIRYFEWINASILNQPNCPGYIILDWEFLKSLRNVN